MLSAETGRSTQPLRAASDTLAIRAATCLHPGVLAVQDACLLTWHVRVIERERVISYRSRSDVSDHHVTHGGANDRFSFSGPA